MKKFNVLKTIQLIIFIALAAAALIIVFRDAELYQMIGNNGHVKALCFILWAVLGVSFVFMFIDFSSYNNMRRENNELDFAVFYDPLTGLANKYRCNAYIERYKNKPLPEGTGCITLMITNLKPINEEFGHEAGDMAIKEFSDILADQAESKCFIGRNGGNKFLAIFDGCKEKDIQDYIDGVDKALAKRNAVSGKGAVEYSAGRALNEGKEISDLIALSDRRAFEAVSK